MLTERMQRRRGGILRIGVIGCAGRMGRANLAALLATDGVILAGGTERPGHEAIGQDLGVLAGGDAVGVACTTDNAALMTACHAVVEFSTPEATVANARLAAEHGCAHVIGTTGLEAADRAALAEAAERTAIVWAPNMSLGVNLLLGLAEKVAASLGEDFDIEIVEMHHRHKVDAPSGTALAIGEAAARGRGRPLDELAVRGRDGITRPRQAGTIGFAALRGGDVVGDHTITFAGDGERLELSHKASSRDIYSKGAVRAALWAGRQKPGLYGMKDVLGL
jgi:4-hydroxy-tetrahydrodipicolinate reductase